MSSLVTVGVPVYRGAPFLEETLRTIQSQTHRELEVIVSMDGPDRECEEICSDFLEDSRFRLVVQPQRLGWVGNLNWLMSQARGDYWYYHQQDDLTAPTYVQTLLKHALRNPAAALTYCDLVPFGRIDGRFEQPPSVKGPTACIRQMALLYEHFPAFALRGLTREDAMRKAGGIPTNDIENFGVDMAWLAAVALSGELHHVPRELYRKRYHSSNTESKWWAWPREKRLQAWCCHCVNMLEQALRIEATVNELHALWLTAIDRLTSSEAAGHFLRVAELTPAERALMFDTFVERAQASPMHDFSAALGADWDQLRRSSQASRPVASAPPVRIIGFGPKRIRPGQAYNMQPDGSSAIWVRTSQRAAPGSRLQLGETVLDTLFKGTLLTAILPASVAEQAGKLPLRVVGPDASPRSQRVIVRILKKAG